VLVPAVTLALPSVFTIDRSARTVTDVVSDPELFAVLASVELVEAVAELVWSPAAVVDGTEYPTVTVTEAPPPMAPKAQVKFPPTPGVHVPTEGVIVPRVKPPGQVSLRVTELAGDVPMFWTVMV
jgi:hypothetical protein